MWVSYVSDTCCVLTRNVVEGEILLTIISEVRMWVPKFPELQFKFRNSQVPKFPSSRNFKFPSFVKRSEVTLWKQSYITPLPHTSFCETQWRHSVKTSLYKNPPPYFIVLASSVKTKEIEVIFTEYIYSPHTCRPNWPITCEPSFESWLNIGFKLATVSDDGQTSDQHHVNVNRSGRLHMAMACY